MTGSDAVGLTHGPLRHARVADLPTTCTARGAPALRDLPTASSRAASAARSSTTSGWSPRPRRPARRAPTAAPTTCTRSSDPNGMPDQLPAATPASPGTKDAALTQAANLDGTCLGPARQHRRPAPPAATTRSTRSSRRTSRTRRAPRRPPLPPQTDADHRRPAQRRTGRLGLVLRRLVERERRRRRAGLDQRHRARHLHRPEHGDRRRLPELPGPAVPVPPPAAQLLRDVRPGHRRARRAPARRAGVRSPARIGGRCSSRSASSSRSARRTSTRATPACTAARPSRRAAHARSRPDRRRDATRWSSSPTTSSAGSGTTCRRRPRRGTSDQWGPGTRIPALVVSPLLHGPSRSTSPRTTPRRSWPPSSTGTAWLR